MKRAKPAIDPVYRGVRLGKAAGMLAVARNTLYDAVTILSQDPASDATTTAISHRLADAYTILVDAITSLDAHTSRESRRLRAKPATTRSRR